MKKTWMFVISLAGMSISAAGLMLLVPSLFGSGEQISIWPLAALACLVAVFAAGTMYWRPSTPTSGSR
ncbi:hypothetical protein [Nocardiopsis kunsanensis]|uniref:hypothetical protein n=1 Tax=Nocardiopsis kunsanensis TaxID=141693 RepID=UPI00047744E0|nr:hypothetical protein [Nocardiopsis kunsanensis]